MEWILPVCFHADFNYLYSFMSNLNFNHVCQRNSVQWLSMVLVSLKAMAVNTYFCCLLGGVIFLGGAQKRRSDWAIWNWGAYFYLKGYKMRPRCYYIICPRKVLDTKGNLLPHLAKDYLIAVSHGKLLGFFFFCFPWLLDSIWSYW